MANHLEMAQAETILSLHKRGWSQRRIAQELGIDRETVARHLKQSKPAIAPTGSDGCSAESKPAIAPIGSGGCSAESKPAIAPTGSDGCSTESKPAIAPTGSDASVKAGRASQCEPFRTVITTMFEQGLSGQRILQDLLSEHNFTGSYYTVRRFVNKLGQHLELPFRRMECSPGEEVQVDFGTGAPLLGPDGKRRRTHVFRVVLSYSRKAYSEVVLRQTTENFLRCLENAFWHFGGVPRRVILDNLKAAVTKADWYDPELNPKIEAFGQHYGTVFLPTRPRMPRHKGKVERGVDYVQENGLKGAPSRTWTNRTGIWRSGKKRSPIGAFTAQRGVKWRRCSRRSSAPRCKRCRFEHFPCFQEARRSVHRDGHVEVQHAYYSAPPEYLGRRIWVRWDGRLVRLFNHRFESIGVHAQREPGQFSTLKEHVVSAKINPVERGTTWQLQQVGRIGPNAQRWGSALLAERGVAGVRVLQGLLSLTKKHRSDDIERACDVALSHGAFRLRTIRELIERAAPRQAQFDFTEEHEIIRPLVEYGRLLDDLFERS